MKYSVFHYGKPSCAVTHTLPHILYQRSKDLTTTPCIYVDGKPVLSWAEYANAAFGIALGLRARGIQPGQRVAMLCENSVDWAKVQLGIYAAGMISVPILPSSSDNMIERIIKLAEPQALLVDAAQMPRIIAMREKGVTSAMLFTLNGSQPGVQGLADLYQKPTDAQMQQLLSEINEKTPCLISYTSGSTGDPKGVFKNHLITTVNHGPCDTNGQLVPAQPEQMAGIILSLNHGMGQGLFYRALAQGYSIGLTERPEPEIRLAHLAAMAPTIIWVVPRVIKRLVAEFDEQHPEWLQEWEAQYAAGKRRGSAEMESLRQRMQAAFGGRLLQIHSSGSQTPPALFRRCTEIGLELWEFYGVTETGIVSEGSPSGVPGMTGMAVPGIELRFEEDGELLVRGPGVSLGYYQNEAATNEMIDADGWCKTGDFVVLKPEGLHIAGRKKDIFNTSEGSNIYPTRIEGILEELPLVAEAVLLGDRRPFIAALLVPDVSKATQELGRNITEADYAQGSELHQTLMRSIARINEGLEPYECIHKICLLKTPFQPTVRSQVGGISKTRVRRDLVDQFYQTEIQHIYEVA